MTSKRIELINVYFSNEKCWSKDDSIITVCWLPTTDHTDATRQRRECVDDLRRWLTDNRLLLNEDKTEAILFCSSVPVTSTSAGLSHS